MTKFSKNDYNEVIYKFDNATVIISDEFIPKSVDEMRKNLEKLYVACNQIAENLRARGVDTSDLFYSEEEIEEMKKSDEYTFI